MITVLFYDNDHGHSPRKDSIKVIFVNTAIMVTVLIKRTAIMITVL